MMKGINPKTGKTASGWALFVVHASQVLTTQLAARQKRRSVGCRCPELLGKNSGPYASMLMQAYVAQAFVNPDNGLVDRFELKTINARPTGGGFAVKISGHYEGVEQNFEVPI